jgi:hypothetical protein
VTHEVVVKAESKPRFDRVDCRRGTSPLVDLGSVQTAGRTTNPRF